MTTWKLRDRLVVGIHDAVLSEKPQIHPNLMLECVKIRQKENIAVTYKSTRSPLSRVDRHFQRRPPAVHGRCHRSKEASVVNVVNLNTNQGRGAQLWVQLVTLATRKDILVSNATPREDQKPSWLLWCAASSASNWWRLARNHVSWWYTAILGNGVGSERSQHSLYAGYGGYSFSNHCHKHLGHPRLRTPSRVLYRHAWQSLDVNCCPKECTVQSILWKD